MSFASKAGALAGNHFATIVEGNENLRALGKSFLWEGAQEIAFTGGVSPGARLKPLTEAKRLSPPS